MPSAVPPRAYAVVALAQTALGLAGIFASLALSGTGAIEATYLRLLIAAGKGRLRRLPRGETIRLLGAGMLLGLHFVFWIESLRFVSVAISTLLVCTTPFWLALYDVAATRKRLRRGHAVGMPLAALCVVSLVLTAPAARHVPTPQPLLGCTLALAAAFLVGAYLLVLRPLQTRHRTLTVVAYTYGGALATLAPLAALAREPWPATAASWTGIALMAGFTQLIGHTALSSSLRYFSATLLAFICLLEPVVAAVAAALLLDQPLTPGVAAGGAALLIAIACILRAEETPEPPLPSVDPV